MTYTYKCNCCGIIEVTRKITDMPLEYCPECNSKIIRIFSATPSIAKCSGFYGKSS